MYDCIIIGTGPAGLSAALNLKTYKKSFVWFGSKNLSDKVQKAEKITNYPGFPELTGQELFSHFTDHIQSAGLDITEKTVTNVMSVGTYYMVLADNEVYEAKTLILAFGAEHRKLDIPGEDDLGGLGVSYCATCDGAFYKDRIAVVVGGGNVAAEDAVFLSGLCERVYLVHRRDALRADQALQEKVFACENIEMVWDSIPQEILGQEEVTGLKIRNVKTGEERELEADGVFIAVGIVPSTALVKDQLKLDENGYICAGEEGVTSAPGVFAAGDIRTKALRQVVTAVSDGANAVASAQKYLWRTDNGNH